MLVRTADDRLREFQRPGIQSVLCLAAGVVYMGTRCIGAAESLVGDERRCMLVRSSLDAVAKAGSSDGTADIKAWRNSWVSGQDVGAVNSVQTRAIVEELTTEHVRLQRSATRAASWPRMI